MAIRYFLSLSCFFHALALIFIVTIFPKVSAEAIRKEIVVYLAGPLTPSNRPEELAGKIEAQRTASVPKAVSFSAKEEARVLPEEQAERGVRDVILPTAENPGEEFVEAGSGKEVKDLADTEVGGLIKSDELTGDSMAFQGHERELMNSMTDGTPVLHDPKRSSFNMEKFRDILLDGIQGRKTYPISARKLGIEGEVHINFRVLPDGQFRDLYANGKQERLSVLEKAAVELIRNASPFTFPDIYDADSISAEGIPIQIVISYHLKERKGGGE